MITRLDSDESKAVLQGAENPRALIQPLEQSTVPDWSALTLGDESQGKVNYLGPWHSRFC